MTKGFGRDVIKDIQMSSQGSLQVKKVGRTVTKRCDNGSRGRGDTLEDGGRSHEPRNAGGLQKLGRARNHSPLSLWKEQALPSSRLLGPMGVK